MYNILSLLEKKNKYTIFCDLDGVLVDFEKGYEDLTGIDIKNQFVQGDEKFWAPLTDAGAKFWAALDWMPDGKLLWRYIKKYHPNILSAPSREKSSKVGKEAWCRINIPNQYKNLLLVPSWEKKDYAGENKILIDDMEKNIKEWENNGGIGILHKSTVETIFKLKKLGL